MNAWDRMWGKIYRVVFVLAVPKAARAKRKRKIKPMKNIIYSWRFTSSSGSGIYETLQYEDGSLSCSCMGWTRRVMKDGGRSCKHTRSVEMGDAAQQALIHGPVGSGKAPLAVMPSSGKTVVQPGYKRKFS